MRLILALLLAAGPALADQKPNLDPAAPALPGAVALYLQAHALYALGQTAKDPLTVLTAARLLRGLTLADTPRIPAPPAAAAVPLTALTPATLLQTARTLDAGDNYTDLAEQVARETAAQPKALRATAATLPPGGQQVWTLAFFGGSYAELAILGHANGNLDLLVTDEAGSHICLDTGNGTAALCGFVPLQNGTFTATVTNAGTTTVPYTLLTN